MPTIAKKIAAVAAVAAVCAIAALSAQAESPVAAENGIRLSEWGNSPVLSEIESSAPARKAEGESVLPELGDFLSEEWQTLGAGATDTDRLRKALANRATGRADDSLMSFMTSRWESAPGRLANFLTDHAETRLNAMPGIENAALDLTPGDDGNGFGFSASGVGMLHHDSDSGFGLQPKIERSVSDGKLLGSFGAFQRKALGDWGVVGVNVFADYANDPVRGDASRFRVGADFSSAWVDADVRRIIGGEGKRYRTSDGRLFQAYAPHGTEAELRVHSPNVLWLEGYAKFAEWEGRGGNADTRTDSFGLTFQPYTGPMAGLRADAGVSGENAEVDLAYSWVIGKGAALPKSAERFNVYTDIAKAVQNGNFNPHSYSIYETGHLYELQETSGLETLSGVDLQIRVSMMWDLVEPEIMRISPELRPYCVPPIFAVNNDFVALHMHNQSHVNAYGGFGNSCDDLLTGADVEGVNRWDYSFIMAIVGHFHEVPHVLLDNLRVRILAGASVNVVNGNGDSPLDVIQSGAYLAYADRTRHSNSPATRTAAKILRMLGVECTGRLTLGAAEYDPWEYAGADDLCNISFDSADRDKWNQFIANSVPDDGALLNSVPLVAAQGSSGEVARVNADTNYADFDFAVSGDTEYFEWEDLQRYDEANGQYGSGKGRVHKEGGEKVLAIRIKNSASVGVYTLTVKATFFYHTNILNTAVQMLEIEVVPNRQEIREYAAVDGTSDLTYEPPFSLVNPSLRDVDSPNLHSVGGLDLELRTPLEVKDSTSASFDLTADNLAGVIRLDYTVELPDFDSKPYVKHLVGFGCEPNPDYRKPDGIDEALTRHVNNDDELFLCSSLNAHANVNYQSDGESMLNLAIRRRSLASQRILIAYGAERVFPDGAGERPLHAAAEVADPSIGEFLLDSPYVSVEGQARTDNLRPIHSLGRRDFFASGEGKEFAQLLVDYDVNVDSTTRQEWTYLHYVAKHGEHTSMSPILGDNPDPHKFNDAGRLPLAIAVENQWDGVINELLSRADALTLLVNTPENKTHKAAIHYVGNGEDLHLLMCAGADLNLRVGGGASVIDNGKTARQLIEDAFDGRPRDQRALNYWLNNSSSVTDDWCEDNHPAIFNNRHAVASL